MLSIGKIARGQHRYYEQQVARGADDYYSGRGEAPGEWTGASAAALGLSGRVTRAQFNALIAGRDPRAPESRLRAASRDPEVAALDLTFSAPKSVSVLYALAPDETAATLTASHEEAVRAALAYLEDAAVAVRRGHGGERVESAEGLIAAAYRHRMSRALDPQLHTHVVAANLARGADGRFTALHGALLYRAAKTAGYLYQAHLRALVSERLGLEWSAVENGAAELQTVPPPVLAHFSKRRRAMERAALAGGIGLGTKAAAERAAIATRERKQYGVETHTWREEVAARAGELGLGEQEIADLLGAAGRRLSTDRAPAPALVAPRSASFTADPAAASLADHLAGPEGLTAKANTFDERAILQAFAEAAQQGALIPQVRAEATRFATRPDVLRTTTGELTTTELVECERELIAAAVGRAAERTGVLDATLVERVLTRAERPLTEEQAAAVRAVAGGGEGVCVIEALAGTGKTYTAGVLREVYERAGYRVIGVAPTGRAARELAEEAGVAARTLDRLLIDMEQLGEELPVGGVVILDEAGMAATRASARLLELARAAGAKVVAVGDPGQLPSVQAGGWLGAVGRALGAQRLTQVMRQRDPEERRALGALHERRPEPYLAWADAEGRIATFPEATDACARALEQWQRASAGVGAVQAVMIARENETRALLNVGARERRRVAGALGEDRVYGAVALAVGDRVICRRNDHLLDVDNGTRGTVRHLDERRVVIDTDGGLVRALPASYAAEHVEHAYALTGHGMQGGTVETALVVATPRDLTAGWSYTALSRARGQTSLLIHAQLEDDRAEIAPDDAAPAQTRPQLLAAVARRMRERDDEDLAIEQLAARDLPAPGRANDDELAAARAYAAEPHQEQAAARAEPELRATGAETPTDKTARLRVMGDRIEQLRAQAAALPRRELRRIEDLDARAATLAAQRARLAERLASLPTPEPTGRGGHDHHAHAVKRAHLTTALRACEQDQQALSNQRVKLVNELGDPAEIRAERDALQQALTKLTREHTQLRDELVERELHDPSLWVHQALGERPDHSRQREAWEQAIRRATHYRLQYEVTDPADPLGPKPKQLEQHRDWKRARDAIDRAECRLYGTQDVTLGIGRD